jgi:stage III sporulation protein AE
MKNFWLSNKKRILFFGIILISLCTIFSLLIYNTAKVSAEENSGTSQPTAAMDEMENNILEQLDKLDLADLQAYMGTLDGFMDENLTERLLQYIRGEAFDYQNFGQGILQVFFSNVQAVLPSFACITAISLLSGLLSTLKSETNGKASAEMIHLITYAGALIPILAIVTECFAACLRCVSAMRTQMSLIFPLLLTLLAASGGSVSAAICKPAVGFFATTIVSIVQTVIFPVTMLIIAFSIASNLTKELKISKFTAFFRSINKWIIGVCVSIFGIFFTVQGITSATYDGVVRRAAKYAIGNGVPIVGGFLSGGFDLAIAGSVLIKNALGSMGIALLLFVLFEPMLLLIAVNVLMRLTAAITQPFGDSRISDFLGETADNLQYCMAGLLLTAFLYFLTIVLMICCTEAIL